MPITQYTDSQLLALDSFLKIPNFRTNSFTFYNKNTGEAIPDAIRLNENGEMIIKDKHTEVMLSSLIKQKRFILDEVDEDGNDILYFEDDHTNKISLGKMYDNVQRFVNSNMVYWFHCRASEKLSLGLDAFVVNNVYDTRQDIDADGYVRTTMEKEKLYWKNKWMDVDGLNVITPDYVNGKMASITANINMKVRSRKALFTGFRIIDATTGLELSRTIHSTRGYSGTEDSYTIPLSYQGPLPDSNPPKNISSDKITYADINNANIEPVDNQLKTTGEDTIDRVAVPSTQHLIKVQWVTCDIAPEILVDGEITGVFDVEHHPNGKKVNTLGRQFDEKGDSSLEVTIYSASTTSSEVSELNGQIDFSEVEGDSYIHTFESPAYGMPKDYVVNFSANKNVNMSLIHSTLASFEVKVNRKPRDLIVDWNISYTVDSGLIEDDLNDESRQLNHFLFKDNDEVIDFCNELLKIGKAPFGPGDGPPEIEGCECCDCCTEDEVLVTFTAINGLTNLSCDDPEVLDKIPPGALENCEEATTLEIDTDYIFTEDTFGVTRYSYDTDFVFEYLAQIVVKPGSAQPNAGGSGGGGGATLTEYSLFENIFGDLGLAGVDPEGRIDQFGNEIGNEPREDKPYEKITVIKSPSNDDNIHQQAFENCKYSFEENSIVTSKIVSEEEMLDVHKLLVPEIAMDCGALSEDEEDEILVEIIYPEEFIYLDYQYQTFDGVARDSILTTSMGDLFNRDLLYDGLENSTEDEFEDNLEKFDDAKALGLEKLKYDRVRTPQELPVQPVSMDLIRLDFDRNDSLDNYFESSSSSVLFNSLGEKNKTFLNPNEGYLSIKAFRHNIVAFDPNPGVLFDIEETQFFPTFDPIYNRVTLDELLEYIYTTIYPVANVPPFPNFKVGDFAINGAIYNPLYDFRNYRTFGVYQDLSNTEFDERLFLSDPITLYIPQAKVGRILKYGEEYFQIKQDFNFSGPILTGKTPEGIVQKAKPSGIMFKRVSKDLYDLNPDLQVEL